MQKIWLVVAVCCCVQCDLFDDKDKKDRVEKPKPPLPPEPWSCPIRTFDEAAVFKTASIRKEVGELFSVDITLKEGETVGGLYERMLTVEQDEEDRALRLTQFPDLEKNLQDSTNLVGGDLRASFFADGLATQPCKFPPSNQGKVINDGKTVRFDNLFFLAKIKDTLKLEKSNSSIPFEIIANTGVTADITLTPDASEYVLNIANGDASKEYQIARTGINWSNDLQAEEIKDITLDAEGKGEVRFSTRRVFETRCLNYFIALLKASAGNNSRVIGKTVELSPCFASEDEGVIAVTDDGSLTFTEEKYASYYSCEAKKITWSYAHSSDYSQLNAGGTLRVNPKADIIDLGTIANYDANACYLVVVKSACLDEEDYKPTRMKVGDGC